MKLSRAAYIRQAVERMNRQTRAEIRARRLLAKGLRGKHAVNAELAAIERDPDA